MRWDLELAPNAGNISGNHLQLLPLDGKLRCQPRSQFDRIGQLLRQYHYFDNSTFEVVVFFPQRIVGTKSYHHLQYLTAPLSDTQSLPKSVSRPYTKESGIGPGDIFGANTPCRTSPQVLYRIPILLLKAIQRYLWTGSHHHTNLN